VTPDPRAAGSAVVQSAAASVSSPTSAWIAVFVLVAAYAVSFLDRQVLSLLVEPIKHDLGLSDSQIGIVQGPAFGICYALLGLPLGWLADRVDRVRLIALAIAAWSLMTMAGGLASGFGSLLLARMGVGIGEAALVPAAVSLLAELFDAPRRALPLSIFTSGVALGVGLSLTLGASFIAFANGGAHELPVVGALFATRHAWQTVFILAGLCGFPVATHAIRPGMRRPRAARPALPWPTSSRSAASSCRCSPAPPASTS
jgi:MFS family permease